jgi:hypothetical protein
MLRSMLPFLLLALAATPQAAFAQSQPQPTYLYKTSLVQAAPGKLLELIDAYKKIFTEETKVAGDATPLWMRHSQGDRWACWSCPRWAAIWIITSPTAS